MNFWRDPTTTLITATLAPAVSASNCEVQSCAPTPGDAPGKILIAQAHPHPGSLGEAIVCIENGLPTHRIKVIEPGGSEEDWDDVNDRLTDSLYVANGWTNVPEYVIDNDDVYRFDPGQPAGSELQGDRITNWNNPQCKWIKY